MSTHHSPTTTITLAEALRVAQGPGFQAGGSTERILSMATCSVRPRVC